MSSALGIFGSLPEGKPIFLIRFSGFLPDLKKYAAYFAGMLNRGIYLAPAQFEAMFVSYAHKKSDLDAAITAAREVFATL